MTWEEACLKPGVVFGEAVLPHSFSSSPFYSCLNTLLSVGRNFRKQRAHGRHRIHGNFGRKRWVWSCEGHNRCPGAQVCDGRDSGTSAAECGSVGAVKMCVQQLGKDPTHHQNHDHPAHLHLRTLPTSKSGYFSVSRPPILPGPLLSSPARGPRGAKGGGA